MFTKIRKAKNIYSEIEMLKDIKESVYPLAIIKIFGNLWGSLREMQKMQKFRGISDGLSPS